MNIDIGDDEEVGHLGDLTNLENLPSRGHIGNRVIEQTDGDEMPNMVCSGNEEDQEEYLVDDSDKDGIGAIDDISIDSQKHFEKYEIQSILKRPKDSDGNRIECEDYTEFVVSKSKSERQQFSPHVAKSSEALRGAGTGAGYGHVQQDDSGRKNASMK